MLLVQAPAPVFASLPDGFTGPQGSDSAAMEAKLDALIEQRTGKAVPLPELVEVPQVTPSLNQVLPCLNPLRMTSIYHRCQ